MNRLTQKDDYRHPGKYFCANCLWVGHAPGVTIVAQITKNGYTWPNLKKILQFYSDCC